MLRYLLFAMVMLSCSALVRAQELVSSEQIGQASREELGELFGPFGGLVENSVTLYRILYTTPDIEGRTDTASGLLILPNRPDDVLPLICVQHGTVNSKSDVPSNLAGGYELGLSFGALGYVTVMPDFLGLGESRGFHPYVHADSEAWASLDMLLAVEAFAAQNGVLLNDQLFITGYSQGGHAGMALHRDIELNNSDLYTVTAASHMSGPYSISGIMRDLILGDEPYFFPAYVPFTLLSYDRVYELFDDLSEIFKPAYANAVELYFNRAIDLNTLNETLIEQLTLETGASVSKNMFQDSVLNAVINDPSHPFNVALRDNNVYEWAPQAPTRILYCMADDQVPFRNSIIADSVMNALGAPSVESIDVQSNADHGECIFPAILNTILFFEEFKDITTDVETVARTLPVSVFPNPTKDVVRLSEVPTDALLQVFDLNGRLLQQKIAQSITPTLDLSHQSEGVYILKITAREGSWTGKILKQ